MIMMTEMSQKWCVYLRMTFVL